ncbi:hypothetical protein ACVFI8_01175 [Agarivorans sp. MS3-6]
MNTKYIDEGYPLLYWAKLIEAICPKCAGVGVIRGKPDHRDWHASFMCGCCHHSLTSERDKWHGPLKAFGSRPCSRCGHQSVLVSLLFDHPSQITSKHGHAKCPECQSLNEIELSFSRTAPTDNAVDPFFGLELALKEPTRHGVVWAYSAPHLAELKAYISAQHRISAQEKWSYFGRLPQWIKLSKNRQMVLKAISNLERRLTTDT